MQRPYSICQPFADGRTNRTEWWFSALALRLQLLRDVLGQDHLQRGRESWLPECF